MPKKARNRTASACAEEVAGMVALERFPLPALERGKKQPNSRNRDMPGIAGDAVAGNIAGLSILDPGIERLALVGPLLAAVVANDDGIGAVGLGVAADH